jgi:hypothetical protein
MESFKRKLNRWGFQRVLNKQFPLAYHHNKFQQGKEELLANWGRQKQPKVADLSSPRHISGIEVAGGPVAMGEERRNTAYSMGNQQTPTSLHETSQPVAAASQYSRASLPELLRARQEAEIQAETLNLNRMVAARILSQQQIDLAAATGGYSATGQRKFSFLQGFQQASAFPTLRQLEEQDLIRRHQINSQLGFHSPSGQLPPSSLSVRLGLDWGLIPGTIPPLGSAPSQAASSAASLFPVAYLPPGYQNTVQGTGLVFPPTSDLFSQTNSRVPQAAVLEQAPEKEAKAPQAMLKESPNTCTSFQEQKWNQMFERLVEFRRTHGHCMVAQRDPNGDGDEEDTPSLQLARWVKRQRYQYKLLMEGNDSNLTTQRLTMLNQIGFCWDSHGASWLSRLQELQQFKRLHGNCNVPTAYPENPRLAAWVKAQRRQHKLMMEGDTSSNMTLERKAKLDQIGFQWNLRTSSSADTNRR